MKQINNIISLFTPSGCLSPEAIERYHTGELNEAQKEIVEKHIEECELCSDALEGYSHFAKKGQIVAATNELNEEIREKTKTMIGTSASNYPFLNSQFFRIAFPVAASIILLLGIYFLFLRQPAELRNGIAGLKEKPYPEEVEAAIPSQPDPEAGAILADTLPGQYGRSIQLEMKKTIPEAAVPPSLAAGAGILKGVTALDSSYIQIGGIAAPASEPQMEIAVEDNIVIEEEVLLVADNEATEYEINEYIPPVMEAKQDKAMLRQPEKATGQGKETEEEIVEAEIFTVVEESPSYPGGEEARNRFLLENIKYPPMARESGIQGTVYVTFVVEADGSVSNVRVLRGIGGGCDEEAVRVIKMMPKWIPGTQRGKPVRVQFNMPVKFTL